VTGATLFQEVFVSLFLAEEAELAACIEGRHLLRDGYKAQQF
jgi:hypothetical protein